VPRLPGGTVRAVTKMQPEGPVPSRTPDGRWSCVRDGATGPCGNCDGCRHVQAQNLAAAADAEPRPVVSAPTGDLATDWAFGL
jgi:hypothetical protein